MGDHLVWFTSVTSPQLLYEFPKFGGENGKRPLSDYFQMDEIFSDEEAAEQKLSVSKECRGVTHRLRECLRYQSQTLGRAPWQGGGHKIKIGSQGCSNCPSLETFKGNWKVVSDFSWAN